MIRRTRFPRHAGDVLTALRIAATPIFVYLVWTAPRSIFAGWIAVVLFAGIAASDFFDGRMARRANAASQAGRLLDHGADIFFVLAALGTYVALNLVPWWVPGAIAASFGTYAYGSWRARAPAGPAHLIPSRIGHRGGILNYVLIGVLVCNDSAALRLLSPQVLFLLYVLVPLYSGAAIVQRWRGTRTPAADVAAADSSLGPREPV
jgi:phosphatidylglycerophosphate synthase